MPIYDNLGFAAEKTPVIFDIGTAYTKCGIAGEAVPRCIIPSTVKHKKSGKVIAVHSVSNEDDLYRALLDFIHQLYFRHVMVVPKERRVVIVESVMTTSVFRETLARVLFKHYEVPSILFAPSHQMSLFTLGIQTGLVMDCGYSETVVLPIYEGIPIMKAWQVLPLAGRAIHSYLDAQLKEGSNVKTPSGEVKSLSSITESLGENVLEDIKVRCCFVTKLDRAKLIHAVNSGQEGVEFPTPPPEVQYPLDGSNIMTVSGKIREHAFEVLFEQDNDEQSIATLILDAIILCPIDMRKVLAENLVIIGGTTMSPGFKHRLLCELRYLLTKPKYKNSLSLKTFKFHQPPAKDNYTAWLGGAIFGALEILPGRSLSVEKYKQNNFMLPDWCSLYEFDEAESQATLMLRKEASNKSPKINSENTSFSTSFMSKSS